ncbi:hypothetical protein COLO4_22245 [Corchorus olitorius]|uniref:F-box domain-containing protein n=1 Tax=Corchorus olitorius TaxID=93759 RepID=A0A1R3IN63_9ROSI|nr:hypothetical protein COLO4_22245 [Corchorus olitorius]
MGNDQGKNQDLWISLPPEILSLILSKLVGGDKVIFHAVCKTWQAITTIASQLPQLPLPSQSHDPCPWLFHIDMNKKKYRFVHPMSNDYTCEIDLPAQLSDAEIYFSNHGWVLLNRDKHQLFLFNPFTKQIIELPLLPSNLEDPRILFFTSSPPSPDCLVVAIVRGSIGLHKLGGENNWETHECYETNTMLRCSNPILCKGLYYCWETGGRIAKFDVNDIEHSFTWIDCEFPSRKFHFHLIHSLLQPFLVEIGGELFVVINTFDDARIHVFKLNMTTKRLEPVQSLGKNMLFISTGTSFSTPTVIRGTCNTIYNGVNFRVGSNSLFCFYSLSTRKYFVDNLSSKECFDMRLLLHDSSWLYPSM